MAIIKVTSPQAAGSVKLKVTGRPKLVLVSGHWSRLLNLVNMSPREDSENHWIYFLSGRNILKEFIENAQKYFRDNNYRDKPFYVDGGSLLGGDQGGNDRKTKGYRFAM